ncbi:MAG: rRNA maturation RNase YbeY [Chloroflexi bacterium]|nr:rRNA maturation RNase YbeY [Chloroflexota bacterium]
MEINILIEENLEEGIDEAWLQGVAETALTAQQVEANAELSLVITDQETVRQLNRNYLGEDEPTDVLSFGMLETSAGEGQPASPFLTPPDGKVHLGEVIIAYTQAVAQAKAHGHSVQRELAILIIHGVLHLLGYDHDVLERQHVMTAREKEVLTLVEKTSGLR